MTSLASHGRLYQELARRLMQDLSAGRYAVGDRMPAERDLATHYEVSRPTVREAFIALEVQGLVEVRIGSGAYVKRLPGKQEVPGLNISDFELTEARMLFEGEAAALAATQITDEEIGELAQLVAAIAQESLSPDGTEDADRHGRNRPPRGCASTPAPPQHQRHSQHRERIAHHRRTQQDEQEAR